MQTSAMPNLFEHCRVQPKIGVLMYLELMMVKSGDAMRGVPTLFLRDWGADPPWWATAQVGRVLGRRGKRQRLSHRW